MLLRRAPFLGFLVSRYVFGGSRRLIGDLLLVIPCPRNTVVRRRQQDWLHGAKMTASPGSTRRAEVMSVRRNRAVNLLAALHVPRML